MLKVVKALDESCLWWGWSGYAGIGSMKVAPGGAVRVCQGLPGVCLGSAWGLPAEAREKLPLVGPVGTCGVGRDWQAGASTCIISSSVFLGFIAPTRLHRETRHQLALTKQQQLNHHLLCCCVLC